MEQKNGRTVEPQVEFLVDRVKKGDREALMKIVAAYQQKVFILAYSMVRDREDALDLVQEVFLRLYEKIQSYRAGESFQAWLMQIARNLSIDFLRRSKPGKRTAWTAWIWTGPTWRLRGKTRTGFGRENLFTGQFWPCRKNNGWCSSSIILMN